MDFSWTDDQVAYRDELARFAERELNDDVIERDAEGTFSPAAWKKCAEFGLQGLPIPEEYGGSGADPLTVVLAMEELGHGCRDNGLIFSLNAQMWSCEIPILRFGTPEQKERWLPRLCDGSAIGVQAMTEPGSGSDAFSLITTARRTGDGWVLKGSKTFISNAPVADVFVVFARSGEEKGFAALSAFLVERDAPGLSTSPPFHKMGLRTSPMGEVVFDDCSVPADAILATPGAGMAVFNHSMDWERSGILASAIGTMQRQVERCIAYARERRQFDQPIGKFQSVSHRIVDMKVRLESARLLVYQQAWRKAQGGRSSPLDAALVKLYVSECFVQSSLDALQVHGAFGYMTESDIERDVRDALGGRIYSGTSDIQRNIVASYLGL